MNISKNNDNCKVISIVNQKGGVGKTTTTISLGVGLAKEGKKVLVVDADPQGNLTACFGLEPNDIEISITSILANCINDIDMPSDYGIIHVNDEGVDLIPSNIELAAFESDLINAMSRELVLKSYISDIRKNYDYILIDCSPSLGLMSINALACSDKVIIPLQVGYLSLKGLEQLFSTIKKTKRKINSDLEIDGILFTFFEKRTNFSKMVYDSVNNIYGTAIPVYDTIIKRSIKLAECPAAGKSIYRYDPSGDAAKAYMAFTKEVIHKWEN